MNKPTDEWVAATWDEYIEAIDSQQLEMVITQVNSKCQIKERL